MKYGEIKAFCDKLVEDALGGYMSEEDMITGMKLIRDSLDMIDEHLRGEFLNFANENNGQVFNGWRVEYQTREIRSYDNIPDVVNAEEILNNLKKLYRDKAEIKYVGVLKCVKTN